MADRCLNKKCNEDLTYPHYDGSDWFCPACKTMGRWGMFIGGVLVAIGSALLKGFGWL